MSADIAPELIRRPPQERLRPFIHGPYYGYVEDTTAGERVVRTPSGNVTVILGLGAAMRHEYAQRPPADYTAFVAGLFESPTVTETLGPSLGVQVDITPIGAYVLFGRPMSELSNGVFDLQDVLGNDGSELIEQLGDTDDWQKRFDFIDAFITRRLAEARRPASPAVVWAWSALVRTGGRARIGTLADAVGWSRKHLVAQFREQVGLPPKTLARLLRFQRARSLLADKSNIAQVAHDCGYYDQAHLIRDFRQFSGTTPGAFLRQSA